jgi:hypothetical protein
MEIWPFCLGHRSAAPAARDSRCLCHGGCSFGGASPGKSAAESGSRPFAPLQRMQVMYGRSATVRMVCFSPGGERRSRWVSAEDPGWGGADGRGLFVGNFSRWFGRGVSRDLGRREPQPKQVDGRWRNRSRKLSSGRSTRERN